MLSEPRSSLPPGESACQPIIESGSLNLSISLTFGVGSLFPGALGFFPDGLVGPATRRDGARIAAQAPLPEDPRLTDGFYVSPTVLTDVTPRMRIAREEIFGPVVTLIPFSDEAEAVRIANSTPFGLVAAVFTQDSDRALRVSRQIRAGAVFVNNYVRIAIGTGFGGVGHSGFGRGHAEETLTEYGYTKTVRWAAKREELPYWTAASRVLET